MSTVGVVPGIDRFAAEPLQLNLAVSLHAATDELRDRLVPLNRTYPLDAVFAACDRYVEATRRKLLFEYVVLRGVNDTPAQVTALAQRLRRPLYHLNLIAYNETGGEFTRPAAGEIEAMRDRLERAGVSVTVRHSPGGDIEAACGQLALRHEAPDDGLPGAARVARSGRRQGRAVLRRRGLRGLGHDARCRCRARTRPACARARRELQVPVERCRAGPPAPCAARS